MTRLSSLPRRPLAERVAREFRVLMISGALPQGTHP